MEVSQSALARMLCCCLICGLVLGLFYDLLRLVRMSRGQKMPSQLSQLQARLTVPQRLRPFAPRRKRADGKRSRWIAFALTMVEDVFFCLVAALTLVLVLYATNDGQVRLSAVTVLLGGFICYLVTLGRLVRLCSGTIVIIVRAVLFWLFCLAAYPVAAMLRLLARWTTPLRMRIHAAVRRRIQQWQMRRNEKKQQRAARDAVQKEAPVIPVSRPPNGRHYFSSGAKREQQ